MTDTSNKTSSILDVLSGNQSLKTEVGISTKSIVILCLSVLVVITLGALIIKNIKNSK